MSPQAPMRSCSACGNSTSSTVLTYKHVWRFCSCGNAFRQRRPRFPAEHLPARIQRSFPRSARELLLPAPAVHRDGDVEMYAYYREVAALGSARGTKWEGQLDALRAQLAAVGAQVEGRSVLDLSGGPGFLVQELRGVASRAVVTEFHPAAVAAMHECIGVEAVKYDFSEDQLSDLFTEAFDVVLIRYAINFCTDLRGFARDLRRICRPGGIVYLSFVTPSLGCCLRWQWDDYTYLALYTPDTIARAFEDAGFSEVSRGDEGAYHYTAGWSRSSRADRLKYAIAAVYRARARSSSNQQLLQMNAVQMFRAS